MEGGWLATQEGDLDCWENHLHPSSHKIQTLISKGNCALISETKHILSGKTVTLNCKPANRQYVDLSPGHSQILSADFSPRLQDKILEWPGDEARQYVLLVGKLLASYPGLCGERK